MKAAIIESFGPPEVLRIKEIPKPSINDREILVRVKAVAVTAADARIRGARFPKGFVLAGHLVFGFRKPRITILGGIYSGVVEEVGKRVTEFQPGDEVCGMTGAKFGTYAQYIRIGKFRSIARKPKAVSHEDAAGMLFGGTAALYFLRDKLGIQAGEKVAINGASGAVGTNAVQLARYYGAEVTGVTSADNAALVKKLGAQHIIDYTRQSLVAAGKKFDAVLDAVGNIPPQARRKFLTKKGRLAMTVATLWQIVRAHGAVKTGAATEKKQDMEFLLSLVEQGTLQVVISHAYAFKDIVAAHEHADSSQKVGNIVVTL